VARRGNLATEAIRRRAWAVWVPDLRPPEPWTQFYNTDGIPFLRHCRDEQAALDAISTGQMRPHMDAVSYLQGTPWSINEPVLDFIRSWASHPLIDIKGKRDGGERRVFDFDMLQAERVLGKTFWTRMNCDFRGRVNSIPHFHRGRGDHIRALFKFARGAPITERGIWWLKVKTADCFNAGKVMTRRPFDERAQWTDAHLDQIRAIARDPQSGLRSYPNPDDPEALRLGWLREAADPFQFVAHAIELANALDAGPDFITTLPISFDGSNSGAQHYSLLMRDPVGAKLTNLLDGNEVNCLYT
jgi:DNA-directed RNA polymerase